jgi:hypothetical protein
MITRTGQTSPLIYARLAGLLYLGLMLAPYANFLVLGSLVVPGDAAATANKIMANELLFRSGVTSFVIVSFIDVAIAWALYILLKPVNKQLSLLAAWFRLTYAIIFAAGLQNLFNVLKLLSDANYLSAFEKGQLHAQVMVSLAAFNSTWNIALVAFGLHLLVIGYLIFKSSFIPRVVGVLLVVAGFGYLVESLTAFLLPNFSLNLALFTGWGELLFTFWLLIKGVNVEQWEKRAYAIG